MRSTAFAAALCLSASAALAEPNRLAGSWVLVAYQITWGQEAPRDLFGARPQGRLIATPEGQMVLLVAAEDRRATPGGGDAERAALHKAMVAYTGRYRVEGGRMIVAVDTAWNKAWEGTEQARDFRFDGEGRLLLEARGTGVFDRPDTPWVARLTFVREP
ncbi:lipocalin-like domain-containing protein [Roseicella aquatilis]|uniref:Lipocalin-like domain-containing protein n=1 Tax=Roseicella aquatilis TaxID=2527868 RepID=A0A4R4DEJ2_9PROT|nr:lipocalin-like domain-containing protein [Roseicella aquatilis]TCZ57799.1 hypothetical protein EXY23_17705 [Roseicella aquatilis]